MLAWALEASEILIDNLSAIKFFPAGIIVHALKRVGVLDFQLYDLLSHRLIRVDIRLFRGDLIYGVQSLVSD